MPPTGRSRTAGATSRSSASRSASATRRRSTSARSSSAARRSASTNGSALTPLEEKLGEVMGLAMAAQGATKKVAGLTKEMALKRTLEQMGKEAAETEQRCTQVAGSIRGKKSGIVKKARETRKEAEQMMKIYLGRDSDALDGFEFLTMAEAGEVGHWAVMREMNKKAKNRELADVVKWAIPIQKRHFDATMKGSLELAAQEDPLTPES